MRERCCYGAEIPSSRQLGHVDSAPHRTNTGCFVYLSPDCFFFCFPAAFQAVQELLESLELEKSSYHMGLSKVSTVRQPSRRSVGSRDVSAGQGKMQYHRMSCGGSVVLWPAVQAAGKPQKKPTFLLPADVKLIRIPQVSSAGCGDNNCRGARVGMFYW